MIGRPKAEYPLLGAAFFLIASRTAERCIEPVMIERLLQSLGLPHIGMQPAMIERVDAFFQSFGILINEQLHPGFTRRFFAKRVHRFEFPSRIDMQQGEGRR